MTTPCVVASQSRSTFATTTLTKNCSARLAIILLALGLVSPASFAQEIDSIDTMQGSYEYKFANRLMNGKRYESENTLQILGVSSTEAFFQTHLDWANGHSCDLSGSAMLERGGLVYLEALPRGRMCEFRIVEKEGTISFLDVGNNCRRRYCGNRGGFGGIKFAPATRHKITQTEEANLLDLYRARRLKNESNNR